MALLYWLLSFMLAIPCILYLICMYFTKHYTSLGDLASLGKSRDEKDKGNTALVLGGGLAGIISARVLLNHYKHVVIVEYDDYNTKDRVRGMVPQGAHCHLVLAIVALTLKSLFPSIQDELASRGGHVGDLGSAMRWWYWASWRVRCTMNIPFWCCSRPFLDTLVRDMFLHFYSAQVVFLTKRPILSPILSTDLEKMGITKNTLKECVVNFKNKDENDANNNNNNDQQVKKVAITGHYTNIIDQTRTSDEFRVVGVHIKKRGSNNKNKNKTHVAQETQNDQERPEENVQTTECAQSFDDNNKHVLPPVEGGDATTNNNDSNYDTDVFDEEKQQEMSAVIATSTLHTTDFLNSLYNNNNKNTPNTTAKPSKQSTAPTKNIEMNIGIPQREGDHDEEVVLADLIVDCTGATSVFYKWCERLWKINVPTSQLKPKSMYVSHLFHEPDDFEQKHQTNNDQKNNDKNNNNNNVMNNDNNFICLCVYPTPGVTNFFGYIMRIENKMWQVTGMGIAGATVPNDNLLQFIHHLRKLETPLLHDYVANAQPVENEQLFTYHPKLYQCRHWDRAAPQLPDGIITVGNSNTIFDPLFAQGMSGICVAALALNTTLQREIFSKKHNLQRHDISQHFFKLLKDRLWFPWLLCIVEDARWPEVELNEEAKALNNSFYGYFLNIVVRHGMALSQTSPRAQGIALGIINMTCSFTMLLNPLFLCDVFWNILKEQSGWGYSPEQRSTKEHQPAVKEREEWQIAAQLSQEKIDAGLIYDYVLPETKKTQ